MNWILKVDNLSKVYRLGAGATQHGTIYEQLSKKVKTIIRKTKGQSPLNEEVSNKSEKAVVSDAQTEGLPPGFFWALKDINLEIKPGERVGLIGQNGSGKSTLLKILSRITSPTYGEFRYRGHLISLLEVGTGFHPELTGRENIYLNAAINGLTRKQINTRFKDILEFSELGAQIDTPVKRYSSGMYMRLAFSVAAFLESEILLIDEVLAVGDADFQKKCKEKMLEVANDGRSVIFVSHDMKAIESICKKTIEVSHGKIISIKDIIINNESKLAESNLINTPVPIAEELTPVPVLPEKNEELSAKCSLCAEQIWNELDSPQIPNVVKLLSCRLMTEERTTQAKFTVNEDIKLQLKLDVLNKLAKFNVRVDLTSADGTKLFSCIDNQYLISNNIERQSGPCYEEVTIPKEFLNEGQFNVSIYIIEAERTEPGIVKINCLSLKIIDDHLPIGVRSNWEGSWPEGMLRPRLAWEVTSESGSESKKPAESLFEETIK
ncbi:ABC transporter ATP-binding protein [Legionella clemsonensis]|uniref:Teichoic acids export ATP-binding protein TagH n=1 Tax=Legionella clemsonensis TaxID=1867846 RepID=A0A222P3K0_9GAMM|nr:ABC transporter ATP-binding protein [Legionella clemsonensis]ASQ46407.1 Teichoic acids export ATP-binding protein TagH [Legionella clemsonensis]